MTIIQELREKLSPHFSEEELRFLSCRNPAHIKWILRNHNQMMSILEGKRKPEKRPGLDLTLTRMFPQYFGS